MNKVGDQAVFDGRTIIAIEPHEVEIFLFTGQSLYEWDGERWVKQRQHPPE